jgi:formylglycine-generating enzyme
MQRSCAALYDPSMKGAALFSYACWAFAVAIVACRAGPSPHETGAPMPTSVADATGPPIDAATPFAEASDASELPRDGDPMKNHRETREELLSLFSLREFSDAERKAINADGFLRAMFNVDGPSHANQGNKAIAQHSISREKCLEGLKGITLQTPEQRAKCGAENMVPIWVKGKEAWYCIDIFEFPNKACELPMVWTQPPLAKKVCELQGKRLCSDIEWNIACRGDPEGGDDWRYAYGNKLDLEICHTNLRHRLPCVVQNAGSTWKTCSTDTEPSGAFPKCRSRFGVFDQHGNVAEVMMRREGDKVLTQLKGSAWFYVELAKEPHEPVPATTTNKAGAYPDHCNFDPRWHVEPLESAMHVNYHLGFRCCKSIP